MPATTDHDHQKRKLFSTFWHHRQTSVFDKSNILQRFDAKTLQPQILNADKKGMFKYFCILAVPWGE